MTNGGNKLCSPTNIHIIFVCTEDTRKLSNSYVFREIANLQYQLRVWHQVSTSWSSAYDISVFLYLPAYLRDYQMVKSKDVVCSGGRPAITLSDHYVEMSVWLTFH